MPIAPMKPMYIQVPEIEDVTPVETPVAKQEGRPMRIIMVIVGCCCMAGILLMLGIQYRQEKAHSVSIYQSSMIFGDRLTLLDNQVLETRGLLSHASGGQATFGNGISSNCPATDAERDDCERGEKHSVAQITISRSKTFQKIIGFGGAFTESSAYNFFKLPPAVQDKVIELYFGDSGIGFTLGRVHINSCDFSLKVRNLLICIFTYLFDLSVFLSLSKTFTNSTLTNTHKHSHILTVLFIR